MQAIKWSALMVWLILWLALCSPGQAGQSTAAAAAACNNLPTNAESGCLEKLFKAADAKLNEAYRSAVKVIETSDAADAAAWKAELKKAEQAWIVFRDTDCGALTAYEWGHGTGMGAATEQCLLDKTEQRAGDLASRYSGR